MSVYHLGIIFVPIIIIIRKNKNTIISGMMPMWMYLLGSQILAEEDIVIPYDRMIITLIL